MIEIGGSRMIRGTLWLLYAQLGRRVFCGSGLWLELGRSTEALIGRDRSGRLCIWLCSGSHEWSWRP